MASFFSLQNNVDDGANGERLLPNLGASAADFIPHKPILLRNRGDNSNCSYSPLAPSSSSSSRAASVLLLMPLSRNRRRKRNRRNPPAPPSLPPTVGATLVSAQPQPAIFPAVDFSTSPNSEHLTVWMNTYNPLLNSRIDFSVQRNDKFNYDGNFKGWCLDRGFGLSAACA